MKQPLETRNQRIVGSVVLLVTLCWCVAAGRMMYCAGDHMIGFHPLLLLLVPYAGALIVVAIVTCAMRKWQFAAMAAVSVLAVFGLITQGDRIELWAWSQSIREHDTGNQEAIFRATAIPELTDETLMERLWTDDVLPVLDGFMWYCEHHLASPGGTFRAFRYRGVVHVRIQKIRHGYRGIALIRSPGDTEALEAGTQIIYENDVPIGNHWVIWRSY